MISGARELSTVNGSSHFWVSWNLDVSLLNFITLVKALEIVNCEWSINIECLGSSQLPMQLLPKKLKKS